MTETARALLAGDMHGDMDHARWAVELARSTHDSDEPIREIYQVGDWGFVWDPAHGLDRVLELDEQLSSSEIRMRVIPGNHENYDMLRELGFDPRGSEPFELSSSIELLPRGCRFKIGPARGLAFGGAVSINRSSGDSSWLWLDDEASTDVDRDFAMRAGPMDLVLTHDAPNMVRELERFMHSWQPMIPDWLLELARQHRARVGSVVDATNPKLVVHGHYHYPYRSTRVTYRSACTVVGLGANAEYSSSVRILRAEARDDSRPKLILE